MTELKIQIPEKLGQIFVGDADYRGAYGGRGAAKTVGFAKMAVVETTQLYQGKPWKFLCARELQKSLKDSVHSVIASQVDELGLGGEFEVGREFIRHKNGNEFLFYGLRSNIAEIKSLHGVRRTWLEEAQKVSQTSLDYLTPTVMRDFPDCELWASWNPEDEDDPIQEMFTTHADDSMKVCKINWYDNPWFPDGLNKVRLRDLKNQPDKYGWIWEGNFNINNEAAVYGKWMERAREDGRECVPRCLASTPPCPRFSLHTDVEFSRRLSTSRGHDDGWYERARLAPWRLPVPSLALSWRRSC